MLADQLRDVQEGGGQRQHHGPAPSLHALLRLCRARPVAFAKDPDQAMGKGARAPGAEQRHLRAHLAADPGDSPARLRVMRPSTGRENNTSAPLSISSPKESDALVLSSRSSWSRSTITTRSLATNSCHYTDPPARLTILPSIRSRALGPVNPIAGTHYRPSDPSIVLPRWIAPRIRST